MKKILIHLATGQLCDIVAPGAEFPVATGLQWFDAPDNVLHDTHEFNGVAVVAKPKALLSKVKSDKVRELKTARDAALKAPVTVGAKQFPSDDEFANRLQLMIRRINKGAPLPAKLRSEIGNINTPTLPQLKAIDDAIDDLKDSVWSRYEDRLDAVKAAADAAAVDAVTW